MLFNIFGPIQTYFVRQKRAKRICVYLVLKKGKYKYKYNQVDNKEPIEIGIFRLVFANTNICYTLSTSTGGDQKICS